jgi:undecaprenyl-phosphate 4-deoxy-4-formamido-L-arabinose transferase
LSRITLDNQKQIAMSNVRAIHGELARSLGALESVYPYIDALIFRATAQLGEVEVKHRSRCRGASTYTPTALLRLWWSHFTTLTILPLKLATLGSFGISGAGMLAGIVLVVRALSERRAPEGWLSLFCAVTFLFSILFAFLGVIGSYLGRMYVSMNERGLVWERPRPRRRGGSEPGATERH